MEPVEATYNNVEMEENINFIDNLDSEKIMP